MVRFVALALILATSAVQADPSIRQGVYGPPPPPVHCKVSNWVYDPCDAYGMQTRRRKVTVKPANGGKKCPILTEKVRCKVIDCEVGPWCHFSECKDGWKQRTRQVTQEPKNGGEECPSLVDRVKCAKVDCVVGPWSDWSCSAYSEIKTRHREVLVEPSDDGEECPATEESEPCEKVDCVVSEYGTWSECDDSGKKTRTRTVIKEPKYGGAPCGPLEEVGHCAKIDCALSEWSDWSQCFQDKNVWLQQRTRAIVTPPRYGGAECPNHEERRPCQQRDCRVSVWSDWTKCFEEDGKWFKARTRTVEEEAMYGGESCPALTEREPCLPVECRVSDWCEWSQCAQDDIGWFQQRTRTVLEPAQYGALDCPALQERKPCEAVNCAVSGWSAWSECVNGAKGWQRTHTRSVTTPPQYGGDACPCLEESEPCHAVLCVMGDWSPWSECVQNDKTWQQKRTRPVLVEPQYGAEPCPPSEEMQTCPAGDCEMSEWTPWSQCFPKGDGWVMSRTRIMTKPAQYGGTECGSVEEWLPCDAVDCQVGPWTDWSGCQDTTYGFFTRRSRDITVEPQYGGEDCPPLDERQFCEPKHCIVSEWSAWSQCDRNDESWTQKRTRTVVQAPEYGGDDCPELEETQKCGAQNCEVCAWTEWTACAKADDGLWYQERTRSVIKETKYGGTECPELKEVRNCAPVDCTVSEWTELSACFEDGGGWFQKRTREVVVAPQYDGQACPDLEERTACTAVDCSVSDWSEWTQCFQCDAGWVRSHSRTITVNPQYNGLPCPPLEEREPCAPVDCETTVWSDWSDCYQDNDGAWWMKHTREISVAPMYNGRQCPCLEERQPCAPVHCEVSAWSEWSECFHDDNGEWWRTQTRTITTQPMYSGTKCPDLQQRERCQPVDCTVSEWNEWVCDAKSGKKSHQRQVVTPALNGGSCPPLSEEQPCDPVACSVGEWTEWSECDEACGKRTRTRPVTQEPLYHGEQCPPLKEQKPCDPVACVVSDWSQWGECNADGIAKRERHVVTPAKWDGAPCGPLVDEMKCPPEDCIVGEWTEWSACDHSCGHKTRTRAVVRSPRFGGAACGPLEEKHNCDPIDCQTGEWSEWSGCNCKSGLRTRRRLVSQFPRYGGQTCGKLEENEKCEPTDCHLGAWGDWSACDPATQQQTRSRAVLTYPRDGGEACGPTVETRSCAPLDCKVSDWCEWSKCNVATGLKTRERVIEQFPEFGGLKCPDNLVETSKCDPVDCQLSDNYLPWGICCQTTCTHRSERKILHHAMFGGRKCEAIPGFFREEPCYEGRCGAYRVE